MSEAASAPDWTEAGRRLFASPCEFIFAVARSDGLPPIGPPEFAFAGAFRVRHHSQHVKARAANAGDIVYCAIWVTRCRYVSAFIAVVINYLFVCLQFFQCFIICKISSFAVRDRDF